MCGIVGYSGKRSAQEVLLNGLEKLEYRGYDSAGVALALEGGIHVVKSKGRLEVLRRKLEAENLPESFCGIGHTRWATHGEPSDVNSHPHSTPRVSIVHNGIIENYGPLKADLMAKGVTFESETDTEVLVKLIDYFCCAQPKQSPLAALREALAMVRGSYALGVLFREEPDTIYAVKKESPLIVGWGEGENFVASDIPALLKYTRRYSVLEEGDMAVVKADGLALGKGVLICQTREEAVNAVTDMMANAKFGKSGSTVVIEEFLEGPEVSVLAFTDGKTVKPMVSSMDHKRAQDGDQGLNTGGMGTVAPNPYYTPQVALQCMEEIFLPTVRAMAEEGRPFTGCLYFGLMLTRDGPKVIEYNCRIDPQPQFF